jgi:hypothetical protein
MDIHTNRVGLTRYRPIRVYQWFKYVRDNGGPDSRPTKVGFIRLPGRAHYKLNVGSRALARGVGSFRPIITYTKGRGRFTTSAEGAHPYNIQ